VRKSSRCVARSCSVMNGYQESELEGDLKTEEVAAQELKSDKRHQRNPACRVYVSNLAWRTTWRGLKDHMRSAGEVTYADVYLDKETRRSRGCGVVEYEDEASAQRAIRELNETTLDGRLIYVREDRH
jgi:RNA recognition motif-containing protein